MAGRAGAVPITLDRPPDVGHPDRREYLPIVLNCAAHVRAGATVDAAAMSRAFSPGSDGGDFFHRLKELLASTAPTRAEGSPIGEPSGEFPRARARRWRASQDADLRRLGIARLATAALLDGRMST